LNSNDTLVPFSSVMGKMIRYGASSARDDWKTDCGHPVAFPKFTIIRARGMVLSAKVETLRMRG
jgi:hypothetical protein